MGELRTAVEELQTELESTRGPPRPPTPRRLAEFTSEVTIPAIILLLETNVRALRLVQRTLRLAEGRQGDSADTPARKRATDLGRVTLSRLDDALTDLGSALDTASGEMELEYDDRELTEQSVRTLAQAPAFRLQFNLSTCRVRSRPRGSSPCRNKSDSAVAFRPVVSQNGDNTHGIRHAGPRP